MKEFTGKDGMPEMRCIYTLERQKIISEAELPLFAQASPTTGLSVNGGVRVEAKLRS